jgi:hypothetical protein
MSTRIIRSTPLALSPADFGKLLADETEIVRTDSFLVTVRTFLATVALVEAGK